MEYKEMESSRNNRTKSLAEEERNKKENEQETTIKGLSLVVLNVNLLEKLFSMSSNFK